MTDFGRNPLERPIPPWQWELSCGLALPPDPPWKILRKSKRKQSHFSFVRREQRHFGNVRRWFYSPVSIGYDSLETEFVYYSDSASPCLLFKRSRRSFGETHRLEYYQKISTLTSSSFLSTKTEIDQKKQVLVAAADLKSSFKAPSQINSFCLTAILCSQRCR
jgi:hypothetical protein